MKIQFSEVLPEPLSSINHNELSIWNSNFSLDNVKDRRTILNASSGKGKTTFSNLLLGIRRDYSGKIDYDNRDVSSFSIADWVEIRERKISVVHQDLQLFSNLTALENIEVKNELTKTFSFPELEDLLKQVDLFDKKDQLVATMSMGQKQRIAIIRALCQPFEWIILDEPFSHLDETNSKICFEIIQNRCDIIDAGFILTSLDPVEDFQFDKYLKL
jgi:ABC-type lipoprotein export system ATPase subunit